MAGFNIRAYLGLDTKKFTRGLGKAQKGMTRMQQTLRSTNDVLRGLKFSAIGVTVAGAFSRAVTVAKDFQTQIARVGVISRASSKDMELLVSTARDVGATTRFSATEAAQGLQFLSMAGLSATESIEALRPSLNLAAAGAIEVGRSADIVTNVLSGFSLAAEEAARVADIFAHASRVSNQTVEELYEGTVKLAPLYNNLGYSVEQAAADMALLANSGVKAGEAGTGLAGALKFLLIQPPRVRKALDELGVVVTENTLRQDGLVATIQKLSEAGMTAEQMFEVLGLHAKTAGALVNKTKEEIADMNAEIRANKHSAKDMAEDGIGKIDEAIKLFNSALDELFIELSKVDGLFISLINGARDVVLWFTKLADAEKVLSIALIALAFNLGKVIKQIRILNLLIGAQGLAGGLKLATKKMFLFKRGVIAASVELAIVVGLVVAFVKNVSDLSTEMDKNAKSADQFRSDIDVLVDTYKKLDSVSDADLEKGIEAGRRALEKSEKTLAGYIDKTAKGAVAEQNRIDRIKGGLSVLEKESLLRKQNLVYQENAKKKAEEAAFLEKLKKEEAERQAKLKEEALEADQKALKVLKDTAVEVEKISRNIKVPELPDFQKNMIMEALRDLSGFDFSNIDALASTLKSMPESVIPEGTQEELNKITKGWNVAAIASSAYEEALVRVGEEFTALSVEGAESFEELGRAMGNIIRDTIGALIAQGIAGVISNALTTIPTPYNLIVAGAGAAAATTLFNTAVPKFEHGGIVPGSSFSGDNVPALMNSREMVLTQGQQANLFKMANGHGAGGQGEVDFKIKGTDLVGVLRNQGKQDKRFR